MQIVIDIPENTYTATCRGSMLPPDVENVVNAIKNGTPLKGHGRLIDADAFERRCMFDSDIEDMQDVIYALRDYKSIIEADKEKGRNDKELSTL